MKYLAKIFSILLIAGLVLSLAQPSSTQAKEIKASPMQVSTDKIEALLLDKFSSEGSVDFIIEFNDQADLSAAYQMNWNDRGWYVYNTLTEVAEKSQSDAKSVLDGQKLSYQTFITGNELYVWGGNLIVAQTLAELPEVNFLRATRTYTVDPVVVDSNPLYSATWAGDLLAEHISFDVSPNAITDWGITDSKADQFWSSFGEGDGIVVANIDTGVDYTHAALNGNYKCQADPSNPECWLDPGTPDCTGPDGGPCDTIYYGIYHGSHTMGTMVAENNPSLTYIAGMAPNAQWIACMGCPSGSCPDYDLNTCADWIVAPNGNPSARPNIVNNSWGGGGGDAWYLPKVNAWRAAGVFPAFSAGNSGSCNTLGSPGDYQESFGSASHQVTRAISDFSSKGGSTFGHEPYTKPNISAPGDVIWSTQPGNSWTAISGTSMASPHSAGAVALLWSCNPSLVGQIDQTFQILQDSADAPPPGTCGAPPDGEGNYTFGYGYLDVLAAGQLNCGDVGYLNGHVSSGGEPVEGATVTVAGAMNSGSTIDAITDPNGYYQMTLLVGTYNVTAAHPEFITQVIPEVEVTIDMTTTQDIVMDPKGHVFGYVTDNPNGFPLVGATVSADDGTNTITDDTGFYELYLDPGSYTITAEMTDYASHSLPVDVMSGEEIPLDFALLAAISVVPDPIAMTLEMGQNGLAPAELTNNMNVPYPFEFREKLITAGVQASEDILVVSKDTSAATAMETVLTGLGVSYLDVTDTIFQGMTVGDLLQYQAVFYAGTTGTSGSPTASENLLMAYLDAGGQLYISDNDLGYWRNSNTFYTTYLQANYLADNGGDTLVGEDMMTGLDLDVTTDPYPDSFTVGAEGTRIFTWSGTQNAGGVLVDRNNYKAIYTSFDFEYLTDPTDAANLIDHILGLYLSSDVPWFGTSLTSGSVPAGGTIDWTTAFSATMDTGISQPGVYNALLRIVPVDAPTLPDKTVAINLTVEPSSAFGQIDGTVTSDRPGGPLVADILIEASDGTTVTLTTDSATGYYSYWLEEGTYNITASSEGYVTQTEAVDIVGLEVTTKDFELILDAAGIVVNPTSFEVTLELGQSITDTMTIANDGLQPLDFEIFEYPGGFSPNSAMGQVNLNGGPDPFGYTFSDSNEIGGPLYLWIDATDGAALGLSDDGEANVALPFDFDFYGTPSTNLRVGNNGGILFDATSGDLTYINADLSTSSVNNLIAPFWDDMDDESGDVYYKVIGTEPYRQLVVEWFNRPHFNGVGNATYEVILYETWNNIKYQYQDVVFGDPTMDNGVSATVGIRQQGVNFLQYSYNQAVIQDDMSICFNYPGSIPCDVVDVPWVFEEPTSGNIPVEGSTDVELTFDASVVADPGIYTGTLLVQNNDPLMGVVDVQVRMNVLPSAEIGLLEGNITSLGYCDAENNPLEASITVESSGGLTWTLTTDANGYYHQWLPADTYTVTASAPDHVDASSDAIITSQQTTTLNLALRSIQPCMDVTPTEFTLTLPVNTLFTETLSINNNGAGDLNWELHETTATVKILDQEVVVNVPAISAPKSPVASRSKTMGFPARSFPMHIGRVNAEPINVLLVTPDIVGGGDISLLLNTLAAFPDLNVTVWDGTAGTPTVADMQAYDVVFVGNDVLWTSSTINKTTLSNNMADYIDAGGKILVGSFIWSYDDWGFEGGRFITEDYSPYEIATTDIWTPTSLGSFDPDSPIMSGITNVTDSFNHQDPNLSSTGVWVASWADGENFVATSPNVVGLNQEYFHNAVFSGQVGELLHNALLYLGAGEAWVDVPWVTEVPTDGTTLPDGTFNVDMVFDTTGLTPGECYNASLGLIHDDAGQDNPFFIPLNLCIVQPTYGVDLEPEELAGVGAQGESITYTVRLTNTGNVADVIHLSYDNQDPGWVVNLPVDSFNLQPGEGVDVSVLVTVPSGAGNGDFDAFVLTATSTGNPEVFDDMEITTTVEVGTYIFYLPIVMKN